MMTEFLFLGELFFVENITLTCLKNEFLQK